MHKHKWAANTLLKAASCSSVIPLRSVCLGRNYRGASSSHDHVFLEAEECFGNCLCTKIIIKNPKVFMPFLRLSLTTSLSIHLLQLMIRISFYNHNLTSRGATPRAFTAVLWELHGSAGNLPELKELHLNRRKRGGEKNTVSRLDTVIWSTRGTKDI